MEDVELPKAELGQPTLGQKSKEPKEVHSLVADDLVIDISSAIFKKLGLQDFQVEEEK